MKDEASPAAIELKKIPSSKSSVNSKKQVSYSFVSSYEVGSDITSKLEYMNGYDNESIPSLTSSINLPAQIPF